MSATNFPGPFQQPRASEFLEVVELDRVILNSGIIDRPSEGIPMEAALAAHQ